MKLIGGKNEWTVRSTLAVSSLMLSLVLPQVAGAVGSGHGPPSDLQRGGGASGGGNGPAKGIYYGDLYIIDRDAEGVPLLYSWADGEPCVILRSFTDGLERSNPNRALDLCYKGTVGYANPIATHWDPAIDGLCYPSVRGGCLVPLDAEGEILPEYIDEEDPYVQEAEFGRLNLGRSPEDVLNAQADEASKLLLTGGAISIDSAGRLMVVQDGSATVIDAPLENLALYWAGMPQEALTAVVATDTKVEGQSPEVSYDQQPLALPSTSLESYTFLNLASALMGAASDKTGTISLDSIAYMNGFLNLHNENVVDETNWIGLKDYPETGLTSWFYNYSGFSYDRNATFTGCVVFMDLSDPANPHWDSRTILDAVFKQGENETVSGGNIEGFAQSADDARAVIEFTHSQQLLQLDGVYQIDFPGETAMCEKFPPGEDVVIPDGTEAVALPILDSVLLIEQE